MSFPILENTAKSGRHTTFFLSCGEAKATPIIFVHGWPELSISWRGAIAGLRRPRVSRHRAGYARLRAFERLPAPRGLRARKETVADMVELFWPRSAPRRRSGSAMTGARRSSGRSHRTSRDPCHGVACLCVPYQPGGLRGRDPSFRWRIGPSIPGPISSPWRSGTTRCSIAKVSPQPSPGVPNAMPSRTPLQRALPRRRSIRQGQAGAHRFHSRQRRLLWPGRQTGARSAARLRPS